MRTFCLLFVIFLICSCSRTGKKGEYEVPVTDTIDVVYVDSVLKGSSFLENCKILSLSSDEEESFIVGVDRILLGDNRIFVVDRLGNKLVAFDSAGNFVSSTARMIGDGPQSYIRLMDATIDNSREKIYVHCDAPYCILTLDMNLHLLGKNDLDFYMEEMAGDEHYLYGIRRNGNGTNGFEFLALDKGDLSKSPTLLFENDHGVNGISGMGKNLVSYGSGVNVCLPFDNVICQVSNKEIVHSFLMNYGDKSIDYTQIGEMTGDDFYMTYGNDYIWWIRNICGSDSRLLFKSSGLDTFCLDIESGICKGYRSSYNDMFPLYSTTNTIPVQSDGSLYAYMWKSTDVIEFKENASDSVLGGLPPDIRQIIMQYEIEDNPLIVLCKLK